MSHQELKLKLNHINMLQVQIFIDKNEFMHSQPLYEFIMQFLIKHHIKGATAFNGSFGYINGHHINDLTIYLVSMRCRFSSHLSTKMIK